MTFFELFLLRKVSEFPSGTRTHNLLIVCEIRRLWVRVLLGNSDTFLSKNSSKNIIIKNNIYVRASIHLTLITIERTPIEQIFILLEGGCSQWIVNHSICDHVICDLLQYTHTEKCNLFVLYNKNSNGLLKDFWGMKKEKQLCPLIDHGQQPMKMHTEVTLLYKVWYMYQELIVNCTSKPFGKLFASSSSIKFADKINSFKLINFKIPASIWLT